MGVGLGNYSGSYGHIQAAYFEAGNGTESDLSSLSADEDV